MIFNLFAPLADEFAAFNLIRYITFRAGAACLTAFVLSLVLGPTVIRWLRLRQRGGQPIREDGPARHLVEKKGTPTMGGVLILLALVVATLLWADLRNGYVWAVLLVTAGYGALGFTDDFLKVTKRNTKGVSGRHKLIAQAVLGLGAALWMMWLMPGALADKLAFPVFKDVLLPLGPVFPLLGMLVMMGASNAVNLTDGLDGLAIVPAMIAAAVFALIAYLVGRVDYATYLQLHYVPGSGELAIFLSALLGSGLASSPRAPGMFKASAMRWPTGSAATRARTTSPRAAARTGPAAALGTTPSSASSATIPSRAAMAPICCTAATGLTRWAAARAPIASTAGPATTSCQGAMAPLPTP